MHPTVDAAEPHVEWIDPRMDVNQRKFMWAASGRIGSQRYRAT
jgi:hypothetical protein